MRRFCVTIPLELGFDREPNSSHLAALLDRVRTTLADDYGPPLASEGTERFDGYEGPFVTHVGLGTF